MREDPGLMLPRLNRYIPHTPSVKQYAFLLLPHGEAMFGGAAGGGKSDALLMAGLQYADVPGYSALIIRRTFRQLSLADGILVRSHEWLRSTDAHWKGDTKTWTFPSGATLTFGHMDNENSKYDYQGSAFDYVAFDELTQFMESQYLYLFSRMRRGQGSKVPTRMRAGSNPGGIGHEWVKRRFVLNVDNDPNRVFIPARLEDNPYLDREEYRKNLALLDPVTRRQLEQGDWDVQPEGEYFKKEYFEIVQDWPRDCEYMVRYWDLAATEKSSVASDPDWTVGTKLAKKDGVSYIVDVQRLRGSPQRVETMVRNTAILDGIGTNVFIEQEPGASGKSLVDHYQRMVLPGYAVRSDRVTGDKEVRAAPLSAAAEAGNVKLVEGSWIPDWLQEVSSFPNEGIHDDQVDSASGAFNKAHEIRKPSYTKAARR